MDTTPDSAQPVESTETPRVEEDPYADIPEEIMSLSTEEIVARTRLIDNDIKVREMHHLGVLERGLIYKLRSCAQKL